MNLAAPTMFIIGFIQGQFFISVRLRTAVFKRNVLDPRLCANASRAYIFLRIKISQNVVGCQVFFAVGRLPYGVQRKQRYSA